MGTGETFQLLLVEDNPGDVDLARERLSDVPDYAFELTCVGRLREAIEVLQQARIDAVLLDLSLPDSSGIETLRRIRSASEDVPIVVLSGQSNEEIRRQALREGAQDFIGKNEPPAVLLARIMPSALERHRAQGQHRQVERLVAASPDAVIVTDLDSTVRFANKAAFALFSSSTEELIGRPFGYSIRDGEITQIEVRSGAAQRFAEMRVSRCEWGGNPALLVSIRDMTDHVKLSEQLRQAQKMEAVGQLAGGIAHDFNNLILSILFNTELLRGSIVATESTRTALDDIVEAVDRAKSLTSQLLAFSRRQTITPRIVNLADVARGMFAMLRRTMPETIELSTQVAEELWPVLVDPNQMEQVVLNLILNARDAMPQGGKLAIGLENRVVEGFNDIVPPGDYVALVVSDTGMGMSPEVLPRIFDPFFTTKQQGKGTGLGLATCYGIVQQAQGHIEVKSEIDHGSTFTVLLPRAIGTAETPASHEEEPEKRRVVATILVVEDNLSVRRSVVRALEEQGYMVLAASSAEEAIQVVKFNGRSIDLVVSDVVMANMTGYELAEILAVTHPRLKVLLTTGYSDYLDNAGFRRSSRPMILKPYRPRELLAKIGGILNDT